MTSRVKDVLEELQSTTDDVLVVNLCFDIVLYTSEDFTAIPDSALYFYRRCLAEFPKGALKWFATENMSRHKAITDRTLEMLPKWLQPGAPERPVIHIHLKDGDNYASAAGYSIWVWGNERGEVSSHGRDSNVVRCTFPALVAEEHPERMRELVLELVGKFPFDSGHAGYVLETTQYKQESSERAAFRLSMHYPGLDISNPITDSVALAREAIKGVNWLTMVSSSLLERAGGVAVIESMLPSSVTVHRLPGGLVFEAGVVPRVDDERGEALAPYRAVYRALSTLQEPLLTRYGAFDLPGGDHREKTRAWLRRLADG